MNLSGTALAETSNQHVAETGENMTTTQGIRSVSPFQTGMWAHVPEPPEPDHTPDIPPEAPPIEEPGREIDLPPRDNPDQIRDPGNPSPQEPPMRAI